MLSPNELLDIPNFAKQNLDSKLLNDVGFSFTFSQIFRKTNCGSFTISPISSVIKYNFPFRIMCLNMYTKRYCHYY